MPIIEVFNFKERVGSVVETTIPLSKTFHQILETLLAHNINFDIQTVMFLVLKKAKADHLDFTTTLRLIERVTEYLERDDFKE